MVRMSSSKELRRRKFFNDFSRAGARPGACVRGVTRRSKPRANKSLSTAPIRIAMAANKYLITSRTVGFLRRRLHPEPTSGIEEQRTT